MLYESPRSSRKELENDLNAVWSAQERDYPLTGRKSR